MTNSSRFSKTKRKTEVPVKFEVEYEVHELRKFQAEGHFVPALRELDAEGAPTMLPRPWQGNHVHALTLSAAGGKQTLRVLSDSREDAERMLGAQIRSNFWNSQAALDIVQFNTDQARRSKDERDRLAGWMLQYHPEEFARVLGIAEAAVEEFKAKEAALQADPSPIINLLRQGAD